jgi:hypothetical protein
MLFTTFPCQHLPLNNAGVDKFPLTKRYQPFNKAIR